MADIEDKILNGPRENYCSSSEGEEELFKPVAEDGSGPMAGTSRPATLHQTGPKGVLQDWRRYKQMEAEQRSEAAGEMRALADRLSTTCRTAREDERAQLGERQAKEQEEALEEDEDFMKEYMRQRIQQMLQQQQSAKTPTGTYGRLYALEGGEDFLRAIEEDSKATTVFIHLYQPTLPACGRLNGALESLAASYQMLKFCRIRASALGTSDRFQAAALPTLQAYRGGELVGNLVALGEELGEGFGRDAVDSLLAEHGLLPDDLVREAAELRPAEARTHIRSSRRHDDSDSDD